MKASGDKEVGVKRQDVWLSQQKQHVHFKKGKF